VYVLLEACKILKEKGYKFVCNFVGGESKEITKEVFEKAVDERGLNEIVYYKGPKYGDEKKEFFANSDIFVQPTLNDCFPLVLLEAMQYKLPIITSCEGGIPDIVTNGENGFVCKTKDVDTTADAIARLLDNKDLRASTGENGYKVFNEKFTLDVFNKNITNIFKGLI
jgi:glycosyltransferase involved in cell wall biosynthesis